MAKTREKTVKEKRDLRQELTEKLLTQMEKGEAFWQRPWERGDIEAPFNAVTGKSYRGVNSQNLMLFTPDPADNRWCTYKQAQEQGWQVKKGAHGVTLEKWNDYSYTRKPEEIEALKASGVADPEPEERRLRASYFTVFHASQIEGIPPRERPEQEVHLDNAVDERLPQLAEAMGVEVGYAGTRAFYRPSTDSVNLPPVELFKSGQDHDTVFLHELSHATGHASRLHRDLSGSFGSSDYAKEELRAELSAAMTAMSLGLGFSPDAQNQEEGRTVSGVENTSAYLNSWLRGLPENDRKKELMAAISDAQKISDYLMERTPEIEKMVEMEKGPAQMVEPDLDMNKGIPKMEKENELSQAVFVDRSEIDQVRVLTSRTDLDAISRFDSESASNRRNYTPVERISGVVLESKPDELIIDEQDRLRIVHSVQPNAFEGIAVGSEISLKMEQDDKKLVVVENGASREKAWEASPVPKELLYQVDMEPGDSVEGTLKGVSGNLLEIHSGYSDGLGAVNHARYVKLNLNTGFARADSKEMVGQKITLNRTLDSGKYEMLDSHGKDISGISKLKASEPQKTVQPTVNPVDMKKAPVEYVLTTKSDINLHESKVAMMSSKAGYLVGVDESRFIMKDVDNFHLFALETHHKLNPEMFQKAIGSQVNVMLNSTGDKIQLDAWEGRGASLGRVLSVEQFVGKEAEKVNTPVKMIPDARAIKTLQDRYTGLKDVLVRTKDAEKGEIVLNGQEYVSRSVQQGFTDTFARQEGSSTTYGFLRKETNTHRTVKDNRIGQFAKAVREVDPDGKILPALEKANIMVTKEKTLQEKVSERAKAKGFSL